MNKVEVTGRVLNCYFHQVTGAFICKISVPHDHIVGHTNVRGDSVFHAIMVDESKFDSLDVMQGDKVLIKGHLKVDVSPSDRKTLKLFADDIQVIKPRGLFNEQHD